MEQNNEKKHGFWSSDASMAMTEAYDKEDADYKGVIIIAYGNSKDNGKPTTMVTCCGNAGELSEAIVRVAMDGHQGAGSALRAAVALIGHVAMETMLASIDDGKEK